MVSGKEQSMKNYIEFYEDNIKTLLCRRTGINTIPKEGDIVTIGFGSYEVLALSWNLDQYNSVDECWCCNIIVRNIGGRAVESDPNWEDFDIAPKDGSLILVYGIPESDERLNVVYTKPSLFTAYYDSIDQAFCINGSDWAGPFINFSHWQKLPDNPIRN